MDKICPACGLVNPSTAQTCDCGRKLNAPMKDRGSSISILTHASAGFLVGGAIGFLFFWFDPSLKSILRDCWDWGIFFGGIIGLVVSLFIRKAIRELPT